MSNDIFAIAKNSIRSHGINALGWRTERKIVVIESDDWGTVRTASRESYLYFLNKGYKVDLCPYNRYDSLESDDDLEVLFDALSSVQDIHGNPAKITINNIVANPDFTKIQASGFEKYSYEPFTETLRKYPGRENVMRLYGEGISKKMIKPQFHGREHVNVGNWMRDLERGRKETLEAFGQNMFTVRVNEKSSSRGEYLESFGNHEGGSGSYEDILGDGIKLFNEIWSFGPKSFVAPCYTWPKEIETILHRLNVRFIQGSYVQKQPMQEGKKHKITRHYQGERNALNQRYLVRNVFFEPVENESRDWVNEALQEIKVAFQWKKPAIISSHRVNYMGSICQENRDKNVPKLASLLKSVMQKWPNVEFMSSDELGQLINQN